jgi:hypothetical protein
LEIVDKRVDMNLWQLEDKNRGGAHLPIMFYTNSHGRRSVVALERRKNIAVNKQKKAGSSWRAANSIKRHASNLSNCSLKVWSWKEQAAFVGAECAAVAAPAAAPASPASEAQREAIGQAADRALAGIRASASPLSLAAHRVGRLGGESRRHALRAPALEEHLAIAIQPIEQAEER